MHSRVWHRHYEPEVPVEVELGVTTLPQMLDRTAETHGDRTAIIFRNCRMTWAELRQESLRLATALARMGVVKGTRVAIHLPNIPQAVIAYYGVLAAGGVAVMTNPMFVQREIEEQWTDAGCKVAITADFLYQRNVAPVRERLPVEHVIVASVPEYLRFPLKQLAPLVLRRQDPPRIARVPEEESLSHFARLIAAVDGAPPDVALSGDDLAVLQYTGGTTGRSKAAMLTHGNLTANTQQALAWFTDCVPGDEVTLTALPLFHVFGMTVCMNFSTLVGGAMVLMPDPRDTAGVAAAIARHRVTRFPAVPTMYAAINAMPGVEKLDLSSVRSCVSGSAPLPVDTLERFEQLTGGRIVEGFGMSECSPVTHVNPLKGLRKVGSIGVPLSSTDARIVAIGSELGPDGPVPLPAGETGELWVRGPQVMAGYWHREEETAATLQNGWLATGDLATMDSDGYFCIVGRKKDLIIAGGYNVYPDEIDRLLAGHPDVMEACTIGVPHHHRGETVVSFLVLAGGPPADEAAKSAEIIAWCRERLARYKVPARVEFRESLPKSAVLKLLRRTLRDEELERTSRSA